MLSYLKKTILLLIVIHSKNTNAVSCNYGRIACVGSCMGQNCATGYCAGSPPNQICVCSRCNNGHPL